MNNEDRGIIGFFVIAALVIAIIVACCGVIGTITGYFGKVADTVGEQIDPHTMLNRYNWFKNKVTVEEYEHD